MGSRSYIDNISIFIKQYSVVREIIPIVIKPLLDDCIVMYTIYNLSTGNFEFLLHNPELSVEYALYA